MAAEFEIGTEDVLGFLDPIPLFNFAVENDLDLVYSVRETYNRASAISTNLDALAAEGNCDRNELGSLLNWFDVYEYAQQEGVTVLDGMRQAMKWAKGENQTSKSSIWDSKPKGLSNLSERELERMKAFKDFPGGRATRLEKSQARLNKAREKKQQEKRGQSN